MAVVKINAIEVPEGAGPELERRFANRLHAVDGQPGFISFELLRPVSGDTRYFVLTHWEDEESFQAWRTGPAIEAHAGELNHSLILCGHSHILKVMFDDKLQCLHMNPGAAGKQGWHKVRTLIRFVIDGTTMKDCEVIELGKK